MFKMLTKLLFEFSVLITLFVITCYSQLLNNEPEFELTDNQFLASNISNGANESQISSSLDCGFSRTSQPIIGNKIVNGKVAKEGDFPWQVLLKILDDQGNPLQCGGSIVKENWILSAAHCVSNERNGQSFAQSIEVTAGIRNRKNKESKAQRRNADCIIQHPNWKGSMGQFKNDVALIRIPSNNPLKLDFKKGGVVGTICLPPKTKPYYEFKGKARISGWGLTKDRGSPSELLMYTDVNVIDGKTCKKYDYPVPIADSMMCQGVETTSPCQGDSGGPLIINMDRRAGEPIRFVQAGIVSFGPGKCANGRIPSAVYTKVSHHRDWIDKTIAANSGTAKCNKRALNPPQTQTQQEIESDSETI